MKKEMTKRFETFAVYKNNEVIIESNIAGDRRALSRRTFRDYILELPDGEYAFIGAPRYKHPGNVDFFFTVSHGTVEINKNPNLSKNPPFRHIADLRELAEVIMDESTPEGEPYGYLPYGIDGHPTSHGQLCFMG